MICVTPLSHLVTPALMIRLSIFLLLVAAPARADDELTFERDVRPILKTHCFHCHGEAGVREGELDVRLRRLLAAGGDSGPAIAATADESLIIERLRSGEMPPVEDESKKVPAQDIEIIARWIDQGAKTARDEPDELTDAHLITEEERNWWAFQPVTRPEVPAVEGSESISNPIDAFLLSKLKEHGVSFAPEAPPHTLLRRATLGLTGLPPSPEQRSRFLADQQPGAWERLIDRLLDSPHYGDHWARHWLDVAGYADSEGYTDEDTERPWAWKYRDYVIRSFNANKPFDQFVIEQLAGDELIEPPLAELTAEEIEQLTATGFLRTAPDGTGGSVEDKMLARNQVVASTIQIVSSSLLGMTVGCAQCHDHRYDPIPQSDYYRFRAIFEPALNWKAWRAPVARRTSLYTSADREAAAKIEAEAKQIDQQRTTKQNEYIQATLEKELAKLPESDREAARAAHAAPAAKRTPEQKALFKKYPALNVNPGSLYLYDSKAAAELKKLADKAAALRTTKPKEQFLRTLTEVPGQIPQTFVFHRGDHEQPQQEVGPGDLSVLDYRPEQTDVPGNDPSLATTGRRLAFARRLTNGQHPLLPRVIVNRIWLHHFGRGLVNTPGDFGVLGDRPTHPALLDWLASEFIASGWNLKQLHRLIMTSQAYRQAVQTREQLAAADPDNTLYASARLHRLDAETIRDAMLLISGRLNEKRLGPPVPVMADNSGRFVIGKENLNAGRPGAVIPMKGEEFRKSIFIQRRRSRPLTVLDAFDLPRLEPNCEKRNRSTVATQALMMMNSDLIASLATAFARRVRVECPEDQAGQIDLAWRLAYARSPDESEASEAAAFLADQAAYYTEHPVMVPPKKGSKDKPQPRDAHELAMVSLCQMLFGSNEFLYVD